MNKPKTTKTLKDTFRIIENDKYRYVLTLIFAETIALIAITGIAEKTFRLALFQANIMGITNENFLMVLTNPIALLLTLFAVFLFAAFVIAQLMIVINFAKRPYYQDKLSKKDFLNPLKKLLSPHIILMLIYIFLIMPNANMGVTSSITANIHIPRFIIDVILENTLYTALYFTAIVVGFYLNIRLLFTPVIFVIEDEVSFPEAMKQSWNLTKHRFWQNIILILAIMAATFLITLIGIALLFLPTLLSDYLPSTFSHTITSIVSGLLLIFIPAIVSYATIFTIQAVMVRYQEIMGRPLIEAKLAHTPHKANKWISRGIMVLFIIFTVGFYFSQPEQRLGGDPFIVSHRGESVEAIENTLEALQLASVRKPSFVEMDVQLTKDNELVVFHDFTTKRLAGYSEYLHNMTLEEIQSLTIQKDGHQSRIPTFDEYVAEAKRLNQPLMVELKGWKFDNPEFATMVIDVLKKHDMYTSSIFQSLDKQTMITMKKDHPDAIVGWIIGLNIGGLEDLPIDFYSIEDSSVSTRALADASRFNKGIFVWTVNTEDRMELYLNMNVTGIITDDVETAQDVLTRIKNYSAFDLLLSELQRQ